MKTLDVDGLKRLVADNGDVALIEVVRASHRGWEQWPGMASIPFEDVTFLQRVQQLVGRSDRLIVLCSSSTDMSVAQAAMKQLERAGFTSVFALDPNAVEGCPARNCGDRASSH